MKRKGDVSPKDKKKLKYLPAQFFCREYSVLSGRDLCDELITHPEKSYGV
jgi:hypothetical protein